MKKITVLVVIAVITLLIVGCATARASAPTIVIIGGAQSMIEQLELLKEAFPGSIAVIPEKYYPLSRGADATLRQIREAGAKGQLILIAHSWGGLLARTIDARNPGLVIAIITIATPLDIRFMPTGLGDPFHPDDKNSETPLYVIAGVKTGAEKKWWMRTDESDGVVDTSSAMNFCGRKVEATAKINGEHSELIGSLAVINQVKIWLEPFI